MDKKLRQSNNKTGVIAMEKKKEAPAVQELRDRPVPPVKGAVTDRRDLLPRPENVLQRDTARPADFDSWL